MPQVELPPRERRDKPRLPFNRDIELTPARGGTRCRLEGIDYSPGGVAVCSARPLPLGSRVQLRFAVGRNRQTELEIAGQIVHQRPRGEHYLIGIRFLEPDGLRQPAPA